MRCCEGSYHPVAANGDLLVFVRSDDDGRILVALNFGSRLLSVPTRGLAGTCCCPRIRNVAGDRVADTLVLQPNEGVVIELAGQHLTASWHSLQHEGNQWYRALRVELAKYTVG